MIEKKLSDLIGQNTEIFQKELVNVVKPTFTGLNDSKKYDNTLEMISSGRKPFARQARLISAGVEHLKKNNSLIISSEMGTGKSLIASKISMSKEHKINMIMCPSHLVDKWEDELRLAYGSDFFDKNIKVVKIKHYSDVSIYRNFDKRSLRKNEKIYFILSKETAKLSYFTTTSLKFKEVSFDTIEELDGEEIVTTVKGIKAFCSDCGKEVEPIGKKDGELVYPRTCTWNHLDLSKKDENGTPKSYVCNSPVYVPDRTKSESLRNRIAISTYMKKQFRKGFIDLLIADEVHELKGGNTAQGNSFAELCCLSKKVIGLTGTLLNGYASSLFYILFRMNTKLMLDMGFSYKDESKFVERFGAYDTVYGKCQVQNKNVPKKA